MQNYHHSRFSVPSLYMLASTCEEMDVRMQCHKAKNFVPGKEAQSTKVQLQAALGAISHAC